MGGEPAIALDPGMRAFDDPAHRLDDEACDGFGWPPGLPGIVPGAGAAVAGAAHDLHRDAMGLLDGGCALAAMIVTASTMPKASTTSLRLRALTFLPASNPVLPPCAALRRAAPPCAVLRRAARALRVDGGRGGFGLSGVRACEVFRRVRAGVRNGVDLGAKHSRSSGYGEHLQRRAAPFRAHERAWRNASQALVQRGMSLEPGSRFQRGMSLDRAREGG